MQRGQTSTKVTNVLHKYFVNTGNLIVTQVGTSKTKVNKSYSSNTLTKVTEDLSQVVRKQRYPKS